MTNKLGFVGFRPTPELNKKIRAAAKANGRSLSQEMISRLEQSYCEERLIEIVKKTIREL